MHSDLPSLLDAASGLNSGLFSFPRLSILASLYVLGPDGALYRDLKASIGLSDGVLIFNLRALEKTGYVKKSEVALEKKKMDLYWITQDGRKEFEKVREWLEEFTKITRLVK